MIFSSHLAPVPPFHSLESGTMERTLNQRNSSWNEGGTSSLKSLANLVLEQNKKGNNPGTTVSRSVPPLPQSSSVCGTNAEVGCKIERDKILYEYEERLAIAEYDGEQSTIQAERIAYQDAFMAVLAALPYENVEDNWMVQRIKAAQEWLLYQGFRQPR